MDTNGNKLAHLCALIDSCAERNAQADNSRDLWQAVVAAGELLDAFTAVKYAIEDAQGWCELMQNDLVGTGNAQRKHPNAACAGCSGAGIQAGAVVGCAVRRGRRNARKYLTDGARV